MGWEMPVFTFIYRPYFCLDFSQVKRWLEGEDGKVLKQVAGKPVYTATLVKYAELLCYRPCGREKSLTKKRAKKGVFDPKKGVFRA